MTTTDLNKNGLFKHIWKPYDVLKLSINEVDAVNKKNTVEKTFT